MVVSLSSFSEKSIVMQHRKNALHMCRAFFLVPLAGVEPARYHYRRILSPLRLPIPSQRQELT